MSKGTTKPGFVNPHGQEVLRRTGLPGNRLSAVCLCPLVPHLLPRVRRQWLGYSSTPLSIPPAWASWPVNRLSQSQ